MFDALEKLFQKDKHEQPDLINDLYQGSMKDYIKCLAVRSWGGGRLNFDLMQHSAGYTEGKI